VVNRFNQTIDVSDRCCISAVPSQSEWPECEKNYTMLNFKWPLHENVTILCPRYALYNVRIWSAIHIIEPRIRKYAKYFY